jgi:hypothetical protein
MQPTGWRPTGASAKPVPFARVPPPVRAFGGRVAGNDAE